MKQNLIYTLFLLPSISLLVACSGSQPGPDKTVAGAMLGAGWGAGAGAVIGNQTTSSSSSSHGNIGPGAAVGAGFGLVQGALVGAGFDINEESLIDQQEELDSLRIANSVNQRRLQQIQSQLESPSYSGMTGGVYQIFFDVDATNLRAGAIANLETIADSLMESPQAITINVAGHSDDSGDKKYNEKLSEARARNVSAYLAARGVSMDQIKVSSHGSTRPIATNASPVGRQLNRRVDLHISSERG